MVRLTSSTKIGLSSCAGSAEWLVNEGPNHSLFGRGHGMITKSSFGVRNHLRPASLTDAGRG
jgi:hypothetical protein